MTNKTVGSGIVSKWSGIQAGSEEVDGVPDSLLKGHFRFPIENGLRPRDVRLADLRVVDGKGPVLESGFRAGDLDDFLSELTDRHFPGVSDVYRFVEIAHRQLENSVDQVADVAEGSGLRAVSEHSECFVRQGLADECGDDPAIPQSHPRAVGVEDTHDLRIHPVVAVVGHGDGLCEAFRLVVDSPWSDRVDVAPIVFPLGMNKRVAVALACGGEQECRLLCFRQT
ncbi:MAG: hypothetical protein RLZZ399_413 [Verrucomicrobiota bacterium]